MIELKIKTMTCNKDKKCDIFNSCTTTWIKNKNSAIFWFFEQIEKIQIALKYEEFTREYFATSHIHLGHSMVTANLKKSEDFVTNTTAASKFIPRRPRISINWNPTFQTSLHKISKVIFFRLTILFFRNKFFFSKEQLLFSFVKNSERFKKFWK